MAPTTEFDTSAGHKYFAAHCFNRAWDLIEKPDRTPEDDRLMVAMSQASIYHWLNRDDCDNRRLSVGYWQASRIQALIGHAVEYQSPVHSQTLPIMSQRPKPFGGNASTGDVRA